MLRRTHAAKPVDDNNEDNIRGLYVVLVVDIRNTPMPPICVGWFLARGRDTRIYLRKCTGFRYAVDILGRKLFIVICMND